MTFAKVAPYLCLSTLAVFGLLLLYGPPVPATEPWIVEAPVAQIGHPIPQRKPAWGNPDPPKPPVSPAPYWTSTATPSRPWYTYLGKRKKRR